MISAELVVRVISTPLMLIIISLEEELSRLTHTPPFLTYQVVIWAVKLLVAVIFPAEVKVAVTSSSPREPFQSPATPALMRVMAGSSCLLQLTTARDATTTAIRINSFLL